MELEVTVVNGVNYYNGYVSAYTALFESEKEFRDLDFANRMLVVSEVLNDLEQPPIHVPETLTYTFNKTPKGISIQVLNSKGETVLSYKGPAMPNFMEDIYDMEGLHAFLVYHGKVHPDDKIVWIDG